MPLCERHGAAVEPAVDNDGFTLHSAAAFFTFEGDGVEHGLMKLDILRHLGSIVPEVLTAAHNMVIAAVGAHPYGQGSTPITLTADTPVNDILKEITHAALADRSRYPIYLFIILDHLIAHGGGLYIPALPCVIDERSIAPPAEGIAVLVRKLTEEPAPCAQILDDRLIGFLYEHTVPGRSAGQLSLVVYELNEGKPPFLTYPCVVFTEGRSEVNDAGAVGQGDIIIGNDAPCVHALMVHGEIEERLVVQTDKLASLVFFEYFGILAEHALDKRLCKDVLFAIVLYGAVCFIGINAETDVAREGPGRGRPCDQAFAAVDKTMFAVGDDGEGDEDGNLLDVLVALCDFVARKRSSAAGAVGHYLMTFIEKPFFVDGLERPPDGLDIIIGIGNVGMLHVRPVTDGITHLFPLALVFPNGFLTFINEGNNAVALDLLLAVKTEGFFNLKLNGKAVSIPTRLAEDVIALHGAVTGDNILH